MNSTHGTIAEDQNVESSGRKMGRPLLTAVFMLLAFGLGLGSGYLAWGRDLARIKEQAGYNQAAQDSIPQVVRYDVSLDNNPVFGPEDAPITIIEFSDYQCPYCKRWHVEVWPKIKSAYPNKVRLVYRDFPLMSIHSEAVPAAEAANCAGEQGKYWEYHDLLFEGDLPLGRDAYLAYAKRLGLDAEGFEACLESRRYRNEVENDYSYALALGVNSTPTFFINGIALLGAQPFEVFRQIIDLELAGKLPK